jgi:hypothetical protein
MELETRKGRAARSQSLQLSLLTLGSSERGVEPIQC